VKNEKCPFLKEGSSSMNTTKRRLVDLAAAAGGGTAHVSASANPTLTKPFEPLLRLLDNMLAVHVRAKRVAHAMYTLEALLFARAMYVGVWYDDWENTLVRYSRFPFDDIVDCVALACAGNEDGLRERLLKLFKATMPPVIKWITAKGRDAGLHLK
jgi:hypothetical protein